MRIGCFSGEQSSQWSASSVARPAGGDGVRADGLGRGFASRIGGKPKRRPKYQEWKCRGQGTDSDSKQDTERRGQPLTLQSARLTNHEIAPKQVVFIPFRAFWSPAAQ